MAEQHDDSICRLLAHVRSLSQTLDSGLSLSADHVRALKVLRHSLLTVVSDGRLQLKQLQAALQNFSCKIDPGLAVFSDKGQLKSFNAGLEALLDCPLNDSLFSNGSKKVKFYDEEGKAFTAAKLPWKKQKNAEENWQSRLSFGEAGKDGQKWLCCVLTNLTAKKSKEKSAAACFIDLNSFLAFEQGLRAAAKSMERSMAVVEQASAEIVALIEQIKSEQNLLQQQDQEIDAPRTSSRPPQAEESDPEQNRSGRVLIVDDIAINQKLLSRRLQKLNFESDFAANGKQGVEMALSGNYDLIFMDCDMPVMNGFEATIEIRRAEIDTGKHVPIVAMTSYDREKDRQRCLSAGMDEYMSKGSSASLLAEMVDWCLKRKPSNEDKHLSLTDYEEELDLLGLSNTFSKVELNELLDAFLPSMNTLMRCLKMSMDERDMRSIGHFAYSLKGPMASLGMIMTSKLTARLTDAAEERNWEEANDFYDMLCRNCQAMRQQLEDRQAKR